MSNEVRLSELESEHIEIINKETVPYIEARNFAGAYSVLHGFTTKLGGVSSGIYTSLNLGFKTEDSRENIISNLKLLGESMGFDYRRLSLPDQVHETKVISVGEEDAGDGIVRPLTHKGVDAQITNVKNLPLIVYTADCVPILLFDPVKEVIGTVHAGWRGTVSGIAAKAVEKMTEVYGCTPSDIRAAIGPSIGPENYEVDENVIKEVVACPYLDTSEENTRIVAVKSDIPGGSEDFSYSICAGSVLGTTPPKKYKGIVSVNRGAVYEVFRSVKLRNRYMLNLWNLNELILVNAGLKGSNVFQTHICTMEQHDIFFSHRYTKGRRGLQAGIVMLK